MILIPAGDFLMGSDPELDKQAYNDEQPQHTLHLPDYYLAKTPVTNAQYAAFVKAAGHQPPPGWSGQNFPPDRADHPVVKVTWRDALAYCRWLAEATGRPYGLPSESEWEKGARGADGRLYPWGNKWEAGRCNSKEAGKGGTTPIGAYPGGASPYGLLDMAGNVWEWTRSVYQSYPYDPADGREDLIGDDIRRVLRGGSFQRYQDYARCARRYRVGPSNDWLNYGFRLVASPI